MIVRIPKYKKVNESFFDDMFDDHDEDTTNVDDLLPSTSYEKQTQEQLIKVLDNKPNCKFFNDLIEYIEDYIKNNGSIKFYIELDPYNAHAWAINLDDNFPHAVEAGELEYNHVYNSDEYYNINWIIGGRNGKYVYCDAETLEEFNKVIKWFNLVAYYVEEVEHVTKPTRAGNIETYIYIISEYKKINESFFDDMFDDHDEDTTSDSDIFGDIDNFNKEQLQDEIVTTFGKEYEENIVKPYVEKLMKLWNVTSYELTCTGKGVQIDVHDHLYLPNKKLNTIVNPQWFFGTVDGNCIFTNNKLTSWDLFPKEIKGDCLANFNNIKNFMGAPDVLGYMEASRQNKKTDYPLTQENYNNRYKLNNIKENSVYVISRDMFGTLKDINESKSYCIVKGNNGKLYKCRLNDVNCLSPITNLIL